MEGKSAPVVTEVDTTMDRRQMFGRIAAIVGGAIAATALPSQAMAADMDAVLVGKQAVGSSGSPAVYGYNGSTGVGARGSSESNHGVYGYSYAPQKAGVYGTHNSSSGYGVYGTVTNGTGVAGESDNGGGVSGFAHTAGYQGVYGLNDAENGFGIYGRAVGSGGIGVQGVSIKGKGVYGQSDVGWGVHGKSTSRPGVVGESTDAEGVSGESAGDGEAGVYGTTTHAKGFGVRGRADASTARGVSGDSVSGVGLYGTTQKGTGVYAKSTGTGRALAVAGKAKFSRSGLRTIKSGAKTARVTVTGGLTSASKMLITAQGSPGSGVYVKYAKYYDATHFTIVLNKAATRTFKVAWMVIE